MDYRIDRYVRERLEGTELIKDHPTRWVFEHAKQAVVLGLCDRVEVADGRDQIVFRWPRTVRAASSPRKEWGAS